MKPVATPWFCSRTALRILSVIAIFGILVGPTKGQLLFDSFSDGNFTANPVWTGNTGDWQVVANSDAAAGATGSNTLRLNVASGGGTKYLSSQIAVWGTSQEWGFWVGRRAQAFTAANQMYIWLYANESNLTGATVDGYRLAIGDDSGGDEIRLEYIVNGTVNATVLTSSGSMTNGLTDIGFLIRVTRSSSGGWALFTSTLPTTNGSGAIATAIPDATNAGISQGSATHNTLVPAANGYTGVGALHSTGANALIAVELDQAYFTTQYDYTVSTAGNVIVITDLSGNGETLEASENGANIRFDVTGRTYSLNGGIAMNFPVDVLLSGANSITINTAAGNNIINVGAFSPNVLPSLTINGGNGDDAVNFDGDIIFAADANLDVDLQNDDAAPGVDAVTVASIADIALSGTGTATVKVSKSFTMNGGTFSTTNGNLIVEANQQMTPTTGAFTGVDINAGQLQCFGTGNVAVMGKGGTSGTGQRGVYVHGTAGILSSHSGTLTVTGTGGASSSDDNVGVEVRGTASQITSFGGGNVSVAGIGGGTGMSAASRGVYVNTEGTISAGGSGTVTVQGTGGIGTGLGNFAIFLVGTNSRIASSGGKITITGIEGNGLEGLGFRSFSGGEITTAINGNIELIANTIQLGGTVSNNAGSSVTLRPYTNGVQIDLGSFSNFVGGPLNLSDAELDFVSTGTLIIGDANSGTITVSDNITRTAFTDMELHSGGDVLISVGQINTNGGDLLLDPGVSPAAVKPTKSSTDVTVGTLSFGSDLAIVINGLTPDVDHTQLKVVGTVDLTGVNLIISGTYSPTVCGGESFIIVNNDLADAIIGTFDGLAEGATISVAPFNLHNATISYVGGDGNDVVITVNFSEINVQGNLMDIADGDTNPVPDNHTDFENVLVNDDLVRMFTIQNTGTDDLNVSSIQSNNSLFDISALNPDSPIIPAGMSATFTVTFSPLAIGPQTATITINNNDCDEAAYNFAVKGAGVVLDYTITTAGNTIIITDVSGNSDVLAVTENVTNINFDAAERWYSLNGGPITDLPVDMSLDMVTSIEINAGPGNDAINIGAFATALPNLTINGGMGDDEVNFNGDITFKTDAGLNLDMQNDDAAPGVDRVVVAANANLMLSGTGMAIIKVSRNLTIDNGGSIETANGDLTVEANQQDPPTNGIFVGVNVQAGQLRLHGAGNMLVKGKGGNSSFGQIGVRVAIGGKIWGGTSGTVTVEGTGGPTTDQPNHGVSVSAANSAITSSGANVSVTGQGGGRDMSSGNFGVFLAASGSISAGGAGTTTVQGAGGLGSGGGNHGVYAGDNAIITSTSGDVNVTGQGGGVAASFNNYGVFFENSSSITAGGSGNVTVVGTSSSTSGGFNHGIFLQHPNTRISSSGGNVSVTGTAGGAGTGGNNYGVFVVGAAEITAGLNGTVTVVGWGGNTIGNGGLNYGVRMHDSGTRITSSGGNVSVTGTGGGAGISANNYGVYVNSAGEITSGSGTVTVVGNGGNTTGTGSDNYGIRVDGTNSRISSGGGNVHVTGQGGGSGASTNNYGVYVFSSGLISAGGSGTVTVQGTGGITTGNSNYGLFMNAANATITSSGGNVSVTGQGGGTGSSAGNYGVYVASPNAFIFAGGSGTVSVQGTGGASGGNSNYGVFLNATNATITSSGGNVSVTGHGGGTGSSGINHGVVIAGPAFISAGGSGTVSVHGTGGASDGSSNYGVNLGSANAMITSSGGNVNVTGQGGGTGGSGSNHGVFIQSTAMITAGVAGLVTIQGTGGASGGNANHGVFLESLNAKITSGGGNVSVTGQGGGSGASTSNYGVHVLSAGLISAGGSGTVTVEGSGGNTTGTGSFNHGVIVANTSAQITSSGGNVSVTGQGGGSVSSGTNYGILVQSSGIISAGGTGTVSVEGTGSAGASNNNNHGVVVQGTNTTITSSGGNVYVTGEGGGLGSSSNNYGILVQSSSVISAGGSGTVTVVGNGGNTGNDNYGTLIDGENSRITSSGGNVSVTGIEGGGSSGTGLVISTSASITTATSGGNITLIANSIDIQSTSSVSTNGSSSATLRPYTNNVQIDLGSFSNFVGGPLNLSDAELDFVSTGTLIIGDANSGTITVSDNITRTAFTDMELHSGGDVLISVGQINTNGGDLLLDPGVSPAAVKPTKSSTDVTVGTLSFSSDLAIVINGLTPDVDYTQLNVIGTVDLTGVDLVLSGSYSPTGCGGESFTIVNNDLADAIIGTFDDLAEGATISVAPFNLHNATISYVGGDGNDVVITVTFQVPGSVWYVDGTAAPGGNGASWDCAFQNLQDALDAASIGHEIWVAEGTYKPTKDPFGSAAPTDPRDKTFYLKDGVKIFGGFLGTETLRSHRDWAMNPTILSGDIGTPGIATDNSYHVVLSVNDGAATGLDGFTITGGSNPAISGGITVEGHFIEPGIGGGMHSNHASPTISNCTFTANTCNTGGALYARSSASIITNCTFSGNNGGDGGGIYNFNASSLMTISDCTFSGNTGGNYGAGLTNVTSSPMITNCAFTSNIGGSPGGGGIANVNGSSPMITQSTFTGNSAQSGGGMYNDLSSSPTITNCLFSGNTGGGNRGGGIFNDRFSSPTLFNCSFSGNSSPGNGGGMSNLSSSNPIATNCIFWGNSTEIFDDGGTTTITFSIVQGGFTGMGNLDTDPLFVSQPDWNIAPTIAGDLHITACSPAVNTGMNLGAPAEDLFGNVRPFGTTVDMGVHELQSNPAKPSTAMAGSDQTDAATCGLTMVTLAANTPAIGTGMWSIQSGMGGSFGDDASPTSTFSGTAGATYTLRWTISNAPCTDSYDEVVVKFNQNPTVIASSNSPVCVGDDLNLTATPSGGTSPYAYSWEGPDSFTSTDEDPTIIGVTAMATGMYSVTVTDAAGCTGNHSTAVAVNGYITPTVSIAAVPPGMICPGTSVTFTATAGNTGGGTVNYNFKVNDGSVQNSASNMYTSTALANGDMVTCEITVTGGVCLTTTMAGSNSITVSVNPNAGALKFDGTNDHVDVGGAFNKQVFSIEMWVKPGAIQNAFANLIDNNHLTNVSWGCEQDAGNTNNYTFGLNGAEVAFNLTADVWQHLVIVKEAHTVRVYINGVLAGSAYHPNNVMYNGAEFIRLGTWGGGGGRNWNGEMDEVRIWERVLCQTEIADHMNCELSGGQTGLWAYYKFNQGAVNCNNTSITTLTDETGGHHGTLQNFGLTGTNSNFIAGHITGACATVGSSPLTTYYRDADGDGYGNPLVTTQSCVVPPAYVADNTDCDDTDDALNPTTVWYLDADNDNYYTGSGVMQCTSPGPGYKYTGLLGGGDCDDNNAALNPTTIWYLDADNDNYYTGSGIMQCTSPGPGYKYTGLLGGGDCDDNNAALNPTTVWYLDADNDNYYTGSGVMQCTSPGSGYKYTGLLGGDDCDDVNPAVNPGATETCNGIDDDCDMLMDENGQITYYLDMDSDGYGNPLISVQACAPPMDYVANDDDCDDTDDALNPTTVWYLDADNDNYYTGSGVMQCTSPGPGYKYTGLLGGGDCDDTDAALNPTTVWYLDADNDNYYTGSGVMQCTSPGPGYKYTGLLGGGDCDDNNAALNPTTVWYLDADNDNYYTDSGVMQCTSPGSGYKYTGLLGGDDCDDVNPAVNPGATETCNGIDDDCDMLMDENGQITYYLDMDSDGYGNPLISVQACAPPMDYVANDDDCDDTDDALNPTTVWYLDADNDNYYTGSGVTQCTSPGPGYKYTGLLGGGDCDDNNAALNPTTVWYLDADNDNYYTGSGVTQCTSPGPGYKYTGLLGGGDCDDNNAALNPTTVWYLDADNDNYYIGSGVMQCTSPGPGYKYTGLTGGGDCADANPAINPGATETCNGMDDDCNGAIDDIGGVTAGNWMNSDVGPANGSANFPPCNTNPGDIFTINATGFSTSSSDVLHTVYQQLCGNGEIIAHIVNVSGGGWAGITLRESLAQGSKKVALKTQLTNNIRREFRTVTGGAASILHLIRPQHTWLRLVRNGSNFVGYTSLNGTNWNFAFSATISMTGCIYVGLFAESINNNVTTTAVFDNVTVTGGIAPLAGLDNPPAEMAAPDLQVYPNPTSGEVTVNLSAYADGMVRLELYDVQGKVVKMIEVDVKETATQRLDLSAYQNGIYLIRAQSDGVPDATKRVVLQGKD